MPFFYFTENSVLAYGWYLSYTKYRTLVEVEKNVGNVKYIQEIIKILLNY